MDNSAPQESFCPSSRQEWREWLIQNHGSQQSVWLIYYKKKADMPTLTWDEAVDEALCFGWIDSIGKPIDDRQYMQFFSRRKPKSAWSKINKEKIERLSEQGLIMAAGSAAIETAKQNGSWSALDEVESLILPKDLTKAFGRKIAAKRFFMGLSKSRRKNILQWIHFAKRQETRSARITEVVRFCTIKEIPKQFRP
ncbi:YdeI/OmpD-associated family protein [Pedobacter frigidisoli]|uniref:YdeI/OmpD-associated family protein n=1 Tax=Pedobacter frigidisoli TaxID=2530455 RepID=UPI00292F2D1B|nr:YdeI/OmpD-associated family protein [Pedobacter frigidisoli]